MAFVRGANVVTDGLVLNLDVANTKSYISGSSVISNLIVINTSSGSIQNSPQFDTNNRGSLNLNGIDQRVFILLSPNTVRCYDCTVQFVVKLPLYSGGQRCILSYRGGAGGTLYIGKQSSGIFSYYDTLSTPNYTVGNITNNSIAVCAVVVDSTNGSISHYINGQLAGSKTGLTGFNTAYNNVLYLGYDTGTSEYMLGNFYNYSHYGRVLSPTEILQNYNALKSRFDLT